MPIPNLSHLNLYSDSVDLPQIKPRTDRNNNVFYINIPSQDMLNLDQFGNPGGPKKTLTIQECREMTKTSRIKAEWEATEGVKKQKRIQELKRQLKKEKDDLINVKKDLNRKKTSRDDGGYRRDRNDGYNDRDQYNNEKYDRSSGGRRGEYRDRRDGSRE